MLEDVGYLGYSLLMHYGTVKSVETYDLHLPEGVKDGAMI